MSDVNRRDAAKLMALAAAASVFNLSCSRQEAHEAAHRQTQIGTQQPGSDYRRQFFTEHEFETVRVLADAIIPADERSGSASDAGVPAFIDFVMIDELLGPTGERQTAMRGGLAWLDYQCLQRFENKLFVECTPQEREQMLDSIAYPSNATPYLEPGVRFFSSFRDLTAAGFFTSRMGMEDLQYQGNTTVGEFTGCPPEVIAHIGLSGS